MGTLSEDGELRTECLKCVIRHFLIELFRKEVDLVLVGPEGPSGLTTRQSTLAHRAVSASRHRTSKLHFPSDTSTYQAASALVSWRVIALHMQSLSNFLSRLNSQIIKPRLVERVHELVETESLLVVPAFKYQEAEGSYVPPNNVSPLEYQEGDRENDATDKKNCRQEHHFCRFLDRPPEQSSDWRIPNLFVASQ